MDCVLLPAGKRGMAKVYEAGVPLKTTAGSVCGYRLQITNINEEFPFSLNILRNAEMGGASALSLGGLMLATLLTYF